MVWCAALYAMAGMEVCHSFPIDSFLNSSGRALRKNGPDISLRLKDLVKMKLFVANIPYSSSEDEIRDLFEAHGEIVDFYMPRDRDTGNYRGFAFITYSASEMADKAIENVNGIDLGGRPLHVDRAHDKRPGGGGGGGGGGPRFKGGNDRDRGGFRGGGKGGGRGGRNNY